MARQRMAVVDSNNTVINIIIYDTEGTWTPPPECQIIEPAVLDRGEAEIGGTWDGVQFVAVPQPPQVQWWQKQP